MVTDECGDVLIFQHEFSSLSEVFNNKLIQELNWEGVDLLISCSIELTSSLISQDLVIGKKQSFILCSLIG